MQRFIFILILLCWQTSATAVISMEIIPSSGHLGETLQLTLTEDEISNGVPDLTPLEQNFTVMSTEHNVSYTAINGRAKSQSQWVILLIAKKSGVLPIPVIQIGQQYSPHGQITITTGSKTNATNNPADSTEDDAVLLHAETSKPAPFINEQVIYTVKLYSRKPLMNVEYHPPRVEDALLISLGDGRRYQTTMNGHEYNVDEQLYAIFSQKSGKLKIIPPALNAVVYDAVPRHVHMDGQPTQLAVKPIPENSSQPWLPAENITLSEQYDTPDATITKGKTVVRTITLRAVAMPAELLPPLKFIDNKQFSTYPEKPESSNKLLQNKLIGTSTTKVTYLLNHAGAITLPSVKLFWFNTITGKQEQAILPERTLSVSGRTETQPSPSIAHKKNPQPLKTSPETLKVPHLQSNWVIWSLVVALLIAGIISFTLKRHYRRTRAGTSRKNQRSAALAVLRKTCSANDLIKTQAALLHWGHVQWPNATFFNLTQLNNLIQDIELKKQIQHLSHALYSHNDQALWRGETLWSAVKNYKHGKHASKIKRNALPPINPGPLSE